MWLELLLSQTQEQEAPKQFFLWTGLAILSAIAKDSVYVVCEDGSFVYPNIYVMLLAKSGLRKSKPIAIAKYLINTVGNTRAFSGRASIQAIVEGLGTAQTQPGRKVITDSCGAIISSEFSSSLVADPVALTLLTDLFDRHYNEGEWKERLKSSGITTLKNPTLTMLVATNHAHLNDFVPEKDIKGGFFGRLMIIEGKKKATLNSRFREQKVFNRDELVPHLLEIEKLKGPFTMEKDAAKYYDEWYNEFYTNEAPKLDDDTGTVERLGDYVLKIAMLLSLSKDTKKIITDDEIKAGIKLVEPLYSPIQRLSQSKGKNPLAAQYGLIMQELVTKGEVSRKYLLQRYWAQFDSFDLDRMIISLEQKGAIKSNIVGDEITYKATPALMKMHEEIIKSKEKK